MCESHAGGPWWDLLDSHRNLVASRRTTSQHQIGEIDARDQEDEAGNGQHNVKRFGEAFTQKRSSSCTGLHLEVQIAKAAEVCECLVRGNHLLPNLRP